MKYTYLNRLAIIGIFTFAYANVLLPQLPSEADLNRAESLVWDSLYQHTYHMRVVPRWYEDGSGFAYRSHTREGMKYYAFSYKDMARSEAFQRKKLRDKLEDISWVPPCRLPLHNIRWQNAEVFTFSMNNYEYKVDLKNYSISQLKTFEENISISPDGHYGAYIKENNLYVKNLLTGDEIQLSTDGARDYIYGSAYGWSQVMKGENAEPEPRLKISWSPDSKKILTQISDTRGAQKMYMLDWYTDSIYKPVLLSYYRPSPGDTDFVKIIPVVYDLETREKSVIDLEPTPFIVDLGWDLHWSEDSRYIYGTYFHRSFKKCDIIEADSSTGNVKILYTDSTRTSLDYHSLFTFVEDIQIAFFTSEKSGWKQLYRLDWETGNVAPVTDGRYVVKDIKAVDPATKTLYFTATGREEGINPYYEMLYKIKFDGSRLQLLTPEPVNHKVYVSPDYLYFVDNMSTSNRPTVSVLRNAENGAVLGEIDRADISEVKEMGWRPPQIFTAIAHDGKTRIYGALWKPSDFDPSQKYPLIDYSYTGPHTQVFPRSFSDGLYGFYNSAQALAELGFIVMQVDGMGSNGRSKAFRNISYGNLGQNLKDHVLAIRQLGKKYSWIDTTRVGIYGHSFGGYDAAHALMVFNDCYSVAVSESADHDWRMEKAWYPELYAGYPISEVYENQSNITLAPLMEGDLLLIHGGIDENVNPSATMKLCEALIKADKYFDLLIVPSARHHFPHKYVSYVQKKRWKFFIRYLLRRDEHKE